MTEETKKITQTALLTRLEGGESAASIAKRAGINAAYLTHIKAGRWNDVPTGNSTPTALGDHIWRGLRLALGLSLEVFETMHYREIVGLLHEAKTRGLARIIDGDTGLGKSFAIDEFQRQTPGGTYVVRCTSAMTVPEFVREIARVTGATVQTGTKQALLEAAARKLMREDQPLLIVDEAETMTKKAMSLSLLKDLYVLTNGTVGIVLVGANDFLGRLRMKAQYKSESFPQLVSRFGTNPLVLTPIQPRDAAIIAASYGLTDRRTVANLLTAHPNYREFLEALRQRQADAEVVLSAAPVTALKAAA